MTTHAQVDSYNLTGIWDLKASSSGCQLFKSTTNSSFMMYKLTNTGAGAIASVPINLTSTLSTDSSTTWTISTDCLKIKSATNLYAASSLSATFASAASTASWLATDSTMDYALTNTSILKYNGSAFTVVHTFTTAVFGPASTLSADGSNLLVT